MLSDTRFVAANLFPIRGDSLDARPAYVGRLIKNASGDRVALKRLELPRGDFEFAYSRTIAASGKIHGLGRV